MPLAPADRPLICLVTARARLPEPRLDNLVQLAGAASKAGVTMVQIRERGLDDRVLLALAGRIKTAVSPSTRVLLNDRADLALAAGLDGVHLRGDSADTTRVRAIVLSSFLIGRSVHSADEARAAAEGGADYIVMGTVFRTPSKPAGSPIAGLAGLSATCRSVAAPVLGIGGIDHANLQAVASTGAAGLAAIALFAAAFSPDDPNQTAASLADTVQAIRVAFGPPGATAITRQG